jgi:putative transposase
MTTTQQREQVVSWILEAVNAGARRPQACALVGITVRTLQRWKPKGAERVSEDQRPLAERLAPANQLSTEERRQVLDTCNQPQYASLPPSQIVPKLANQGIYLASESSFYRILHAAC